MQGLKSPKRFQRNLLSGLFANMLKMIITNGLPIILKHFLIITTQIGSGLKEELTIIQNDARKIPLDDNSVDFVFIDSPYSDNIKYSDEKQCVGKISCEKIEFYDELEKVASEITRILKPEKAMGWVIADQWIKKKFTPVGFLLWQRLEKYFEPIDIICLTRKN